jgi:hypothetical protein
MHGHEVHDLYSSPNTIRVFQTGMMRWARHVACLGEKRGAYRILVGKPESNRPLGRPRLRWDDNIRIDLNEIGWEGMEWIDLAQDRDKKQALENTVVKCWVP